MNLAGMLISSMILGSLGAWAVAKLGGKVHLIDIPNKRSSHSALTPKGGGIGIAGAFMLASLTAGLKVHVWLPLLILSGLAFFGDRFELSPKLRLTAQFFLAGLIIIRIEQVYSPVILSISIGILWMLFIVGTANFYNFMDGINGIAGISGIIGFGLLGWYIRFAEIETSASIVALALSFACLGFLPFNFPIARVFMGDVGSILLGATFAVLICLESRTILDFLCMVSFMFPFYADELTTMLVRLHKGESLIRPHRKHLYQLLANEKGLAHWKVSVGYGVLQLTVGLSVFIARPHGPVIVLLILTGWFMVFWLKSRSIRLKISEVI